MIHPVLLRQFRRLGATPDEPPDPATWARLVDLLSTTYTGHDQAHYLLERSLALSSNEMSELHHRLRRDRERLEAVIHSLDRGLIVLDPDLAVELANPEAARILGTTMPELHTWDVADLRLATRKDAGLAALFDDVGTGPAGAAGRRRSCEEGWLTARDDRQVPVAGSFMPIRDDGRVRGAVVVLRDLSARRRLEVELRAAQKLEAVGRLAAGVAHELNTPIQFVGDNLRFIQDSVPDLLNMVRVCGEVVAAETDDAPGRHRLVTALEDCDPDFVTEELRPALAQSLEGIERVASIVMAMKSFSHPGASAAPADLNAALHDSVTVARGEFRHIAEVEFRLGELPTVVCLVHELKQAFLNLVVNAAHAIADRQADRPGHGLITVSTSCPGDGTVLVEIGDNGCGIPPELAERVFEPFFTTKDVGRGTGQGLALARSVITDAHHGRLSFDSEPGRGTTFRAVLPVGTEEKPSRSANPTDPAQYAH